MKCNKVGITWLGVVFVIVVFALTLEVVKADSHVSKACFKWDAPVGEQKTCSRLGKQSVIVGAGWSNSQDSGMLQFKYRPTKYWDFFGMVWTDNDEGADPATVQTTQTYRYRNRKREITTTTVVTPGDDGDTANLAFGFARCAEYGIGRGCGGLAYVTNDDTANIDQHVMVYLEGTFVVPENPVVNRCGLYHLSDGGSSDENFIGCGKEW